MITKKMIEKYDNLVWINDRNGLLIEISKDFNIDSYTVIFEYIEKLHNIQGYLLHELALLRKNYSDEMKIILRDRLNEKDFSILSEYI